MMEKNPDVFFIWFLTLTFLINVYVNNGLFFL